MHVLMLLRDMGLDPASIKLTLRVAVDNDLVAIKLNGTALPGLDRACPRGGGQATPRQFGDRPAARRHRADRSWRRGFGQRRPAMTTPLSSILFVVVAGLIGSFGAVFLKAGAQRLEKNLMAILHNWRLLAGVGAYLLSSVFFVLGLRRGELEAVRWRI